MKSNISSPHSLTVGEGFVNPIGFHNPCPCFSWKLPESVRCQTAYHLTVESEQELWDSGWVESGQSVLVPYGGESFRSRERVLWKVRFRDEQGENSAWSAPSSFELGLLSNDDWFAKWISIPAEENNEQVGTFRKSFASEHAVARARLHVTAKGVFDLHLNGARVGRDHFANGWTAYAQRIDTLTYDVTDAVHQGDNLLQARLAGGWYAGRLGWKHDPSLKSRTPELLLQLEITHSDGSMHTVTSDGSWEGTFEGPILRSGYYDGEEYDARVRTTGWKAVRVNPELGPAQLSPKPFAPPRFVEELRPVAITEPEPGHFVFNLGQNMVGVPRLRIPGAGDHTITVRYAELLNPDGTLYTENYRSAKSTDTHTAAEDGMIDWTPAFTFHGFQYVELSGLPEGIQPETGWVTGLVLHSDLRRSGSFTSSHPTLNQLYSNIVWGQRGNFLDIPTDCPQRDERLGWTGDAQVFAATACFNYDCHAFFKSWLHTLRQEQYEDGRIPNVVPNILGKGASPGWQDAATIIPWDVYVRTGDTQILEENYDMMSRLVAWYRENTQSGLGGNSFVFGDWLQPFAQNTHGDTPGDLIHAAFYVKSLSNLAESARVLERTEDADRLAAELRDVKQTIAGYFLDADGKLRNAPETQTGYLLLLEFEVVPDRLSQRTTAHLAGLLEKESNGHLRTGFLGTPCLAPVLERNGRADLAFGALFKDTYPSWFYSIHQGATTMWERWNSYSHEHGFGDVGMNSFNHYAYGAIGQWMFERIAGLAPDPAHPGYKHFFIRPLPGGPLASAQVSLETPYGTAVSGWTLEHGVFTLDITVPPNSTATVILPGRENDPVSAVPGTRRFRVRLTGATLEIG